MAHLVEGAHTRLSFASTALLRLADLMSRNHNRCSIAAGAWDPIADYGLDLRLVKVGGNALRGWSQDALAVSVTSFSLFMACPIS